MSDLIQSVFFKRLIEKSDSALQYMVDNSSNMNGDAVEVARYILDERSKSVDYTAYSLLDLMEAKEAINRTLYPVRAQLLDRELIKRQYDDDINQKRLKHLETFKEPDQSSSIRPRVDVVLKKQGSEKHSEPDVEISQSEFARLLREPKAYQSLLIEDSSTQLYLYFNVSKDEYGFRFWYVERYTKAEFKSRLHGISRSFALSFAKDFIERGNTVLNDIEWNKVKKPKPTFTNGIIAYTIIGYVTAVLTVFVYERIEYYILKTNKVQSIISLIPYRKEAIFILGLVALIISAIRDRKQLLNLHKLTVHEVIDTVRILILIPLGLFFIYYFILMD